VSDHDPTNSPPRSTGLRNGTTPPPAAPTKVLFVHHRNELGGAPTSLSYLIRFLDPKRFEAHVYCPSGRSAELFREAGATVHEGSVASFTHIWASTYRGRRWLLFVREAFRLPGHLLSFNRLLRRERFDLIHLNDSPLIPAAWLARRRRLPIVWHLRSALPHGGADFRSRLVRRMILRLADTTIAINEDIASVWKVPACVVPNSVEVDQFRPGDPQAARAKLALEPDRPVVAYFGFLYPSKGFREFIRAASNLRSEGVEATYLIVGSGVRGDDFFQSAVGRTLQLLDLARDYNAEARKLVAELDLEDAVIFVPFTQDIDELYRASDIVVAPSQGPEIGRPMIEAAASGVAVVGTGSRTGGGILKPDETTVFTPDFLAETLSTAIMSLLRDPERRRAMGVAARSHALEVFNPARNAQRVEEIYDRILPNPRRTKVLFVHHRPQLGGAPRSLAELIRNLDRDLYDPHVFVPDGPSALLFAEAGAIVHVGPVSVFAHAWDNPYAGFRWLVLSREIWLLVPHVRALNTLVRRYRFPLVHLNDSPLLPAAWVAHRRGSHVVWHLRSALAGGGRDRRSRIITRLIDRCGSAAIAIDRDVAARFPIQLPLSVIFNSVPPPESTSDADLGAARLGMPLDKVAIGYAGFVRSEKGWPELVRAMRILIDAGLPAHLVIIGGGVRPPAYFKTFRGRLLQLANVLTDEESAIKQLVDELELESNVYFSPFQPQLREVYRALDIVTFPNPGVGLGRPVLEAAAYGKPVVASGSSDGAGLLLPEVTGILLDKPNPQVIADALHRLIVDADLRKRMGTAAARHARVQFDPVRNARLVEQIYINLTAPPASVARGSSDLDDLEAPKPAPTRA
jgi:glycosyltransferase involved in cell wall biosynthesis